MKMRKGQRRRMKGVRRARRVRKTAVAKRMKMKMRVHRA
jgi:hypothetical protein